HDVTDGELCAGINGTPNTCNADSGGPLTVQRATGCEEQVGLLNWGYLGCGGYSVYARVSHHYDWIQQNVENLGGNTTYQAETMFHSTGTTHPDGWNIYNNGYASFNHTFTGGSTTMIIRAAGKNGQGWPQMRVTVGTQEVLNIQVPSADWLDIPVTFNAPTGNAEVRVYFTNDLYLPNNNPPVDRNLFLEKVVVEGKTACTGQDDAVTATLNVYDDWGSGYCARVVVTNTHSSPTTSWSVVVNAGNSTVFNSWNPPNKSGSGTHTFSSVSWNAAVAPNATYNQSGFCANRVQGSNTLPVVQDVTATF
ncbi:MAG TPA: carbohydrate-binding domain-containing protein, partial [Polyangiaceae bacterium]|nr:carbohydrate-binding domain-containing protein [Polyangiaceae bacterium]